MAPSVRAFLLALAVAATVGVGPVLAGYPRTSSNAVGDVLGLSPTGATYVRTAKAADDDLVKPDLLQGGIAALNRFTQYSQSRSKFDDDRCAPTTAIALCLSRSQLRSTYSTTVCLNRLVDVAKKLSFGEEKDWLNGLKKRIAKGTFTYGELGRLAYVLLDEYQTEPETGPIDWDHPGMSGEDLFKHLLGPSGVPRPKLRRNKDGSEYIDLANGVAWPIQVAVGGGGVMNHWLLKGRTRDGIDYIYDPLPVRGGPQVYFREGPPDNGQGYAKYLDNIINACQGCGFAPIKPVKH